jgi:hypothetical protein
MVATNTNSFRAAAVDVTAYVLRSGTAAFSVATAGNNDISLSALHPNTSVHIVVPGRYNHAHARFCQSHTLTLFSFLVSFVPYQTR